EVPFPFVARTRYEYVVPEASPTSAYVATSVPVLATVAQCAPASALRSTANPLSSAELSVQERSIWALDTATAASPVGAAGGVPAEHPTAPRSTGPTIARGAPWWCFPYSWSTGNAAAASAVPASTQADPAVRWKSCAPSSMKPGDVPVTLPPRSLTAP